MLVLGTLVGLLLAEAGLRLEGYTPRVSRSVISNWNRVPPPFPGGGYLHHAHDTYRQSWPSDSRGYFGSPGPHLDYRLNNYGFRDRDFDLSRNARLRVAVLGDSICFGHGVKSQDVLTRRLERMLERERPLGRQYEVYDFCLQGYNTQDEASLYEHVVSYFRPDILLIVYFLNDVNLPPRREFGPLPDVSPLVAALRRRLDVADLAFEGLFGPSYRARFIRQGRLAYQEDQPGLHSVTRGLERIAQRARADRVPVLFAVFPWLSDLDRDSYPFLAAHREVLRIAARLGFRTVDLLDALSGHDAEKLWVHVIDHHPNELAHELTADALYPRIVSLLDDFDEALVEGAAERRRIPIPTALAAPPGREWYRAFGGGTSREPEVAPPAGTDDGHE